MNGVNNNLSNRKSYEAKQKDLEDLLNINKALIDAINQILLDKTVSDNAQNNRMDGIDSTITGIHNMVNGINGRLTALENKP